MGKKVLVLTYYFPPSGGAGVQRWLKMLRYFPDNGLEPIVLTPNPQQASYPQRDASLVQEIPAGLRIETTPTFEILTLLKRWRGEKSLPHSGFSETDHPSPGQKTMRFVRGNFFLPDARRGWNRYAYEKAVELIEKEDIVAVVTTSPPHSTQLVGQRLKKRFPQIAWVADLRDPWTDIYYTERLYPMRWAKALNRRMEAHVVCQADAVWTTCESTCRTLSERYPEAAGRISVLTNGYDERDFADKALPRQPYITYIGTLTDPHDLDGFWPAFRQCGLRFRMVGESALDGHVPADVRDRVQCVPRVPHAEAIARMMESTALLLVTPRVGEASAVVPGKLFEYLAARRPVLALTHPDSDAAVILRQQCAGVVADYNDTDTMAHFLHSPDSFYQPTDSSHYSRRSLAAEAARRIACCISAIQPV